MEGSMGPDYLDALAQLDRSASKAPWRVDTLDDDACMSMLAVTSGRVATFGNKDWEPEHVIAACLVQSPPYVTPEDRRWSENAALIAEMRNALPELIRLARIGLTHDQA
jgi:hypothetical protein